MGRINEEQELIETLSRATDLLFNSGLIDLGDYNAIREKIESEVREAKEKAK